MYHYLNAITNTKGDALIGYYVKATDPSTGDVVSIYADDSLTPILSVSGLANSAKVDSDGNVSFYIVSGTYNLDIYATNGTTLVKSIANVPMNAGADVSLGAATRTALAGMTTSSAILLSEEGRAGLFKFDSSDLEDKVAVDTAEGIYVAPATDPTGASGAWVRQFDGPINADWFGFTRGNVVDNSAAMTSLLSYLEAVGLAPAYPAIINTPEVRFRLGRYYFASPISVEITVHWTGEGGSQVFADGTVFECLTGGITLGVNADHSVIRHIKTFSRQARPSAANYAAQATHGFRLLSRAILENCKAEQFTGDGLLMETDGIAGANVSGSIIRDCVFNDNGRNGVNNSGGDASAITFDHIEANGNNEWGIKDAGFLSNGHKDHHTSTNGYGTGPKGDGLSAIAFNDGHLWVVTPGQEVAASTTEPGTNAAVWADLGASAQYSNPQWVTGMTWRAGGSMYCSTANTTVFLNCYAEGDQGPTYFLQDGILLGGTGALHPNSAGSHISIDSNGALSVSAGLSVAGRVTAMGDSELGPSSGGFNSVTYFNHSNSAASLSFRRYNSAGVLQATDATISVQSGFGIRYGTTWNHEFACGGAVTGYVTANGIELESGKEVRINNQRVLSARGAALPADATDLATALTLVNAIKARIKTTGGHGLVAD
jgi:hypothetical protein